MSATTRQTNLLVQQDWTKIYQTFQNADFESYDFETLRQSMISYLRTYYPEDFNDYLESSEYVALLDLLAFMGQSLAFRTDLNARENFIDTAQRRDSVLKLARLISYNPKRNTGASGLMKFDYVSTSETVYDSSGLNLSGIPIFWNDPNNPNWVEQFALVLNASLVNSQMVGKPGNTANIFGVRTEEYTINLPPAKLPTFPYSETVEGTSMDFEIVSPTSAGKDYLYEVTPNPKPLFNILYRNDNLGNNSKDTGWFVYFKQGTLATVDFTLSDSLPNRVVSINVNNINNDDIWVFQLDANGNPSTQWTVVESVSGYNVIYNTTNIRTLVQVNTRSNDQVDLVFGDGSFADIPIGTFRAFYRTSNGLSYNLNTAEMQGVVTPINYVSRNGSVQTLTIKSSLQNNVTNSSPRETLASIKTNAPQAYYTQNRMITAEDYNIFPFTQFSDIIKIKTTNRSSSGISRYLDVIDVTGKYSSTNIFCDDGVLYQKETIELQQYSPPNNGDIAGSLNQVINNELFVNNIVAFNQFSYNYFQRFTTDTVAINGTIFYAVWTQLTVGTNESTGFFATSLNYNATLLAGSGYAIPLLVGTSSSTTMAYVLPGTIVRFRGSVDLTVDPTYFDANNNIQMGTPSKPGDRTYIYATVVGLNGNGTNGGIITANAPGPIALSAFIPSGAVIDQIIPKFYNTVPSNVLISAATLVNGNKNFGLRFDQVNKTWAVIQPQDLNLTQTSSELITVSTVNAEWNALYAGDTSANGLDSSWVLAFVNTSQGYNIYYRQLNYIFASEKETTFYFDPSVRVYDSKTGTVITDQVSVLKTNNNPDSSTPLFTDKTWFIHDMIVDPDGYQNVDKILLQYPDVNRDGIPDNPDLFTEIVNPATNSQSKNVYFQQSFSVTNSYEQYVILPSGTVEDIYGSQADIVKIYGQYKDGQIFYAYNENTFYVLSVVTSLGVTTRSLSASANGTKFLWYKGRQNLYFQYRHAAPGNRRIDPSPSNIMDLYIMTTEYATAYQAWIQDTTGTIVEPTAPTTDALESAYAKLENYKAMSDTLIYSSGKFKPLFGAKADPILQATFKVVKNPNIVVSDNDVKSAVISAINNFFNIANWDFGETFYFSELSAYLHQALLPNVSSIIIVPNSTSQSFGNLYQINAEPNEILISAATVENVQIITNITAANLQ